MDRVRCVLVAVLAVAVCVVAASPAVAAKGGNRDNAHACQQGGHKSRFEAETGRPFNNAGDCASHGAQRGDTSSLVIDNSGSYHCTNSSLTCWGTLSGSGLAPNAQWFVHILDGTTLSGIATSGGSIDAVTLNILCGQDRTAFAQSTTSAGQRINSPAADPPC
jgi:hypothetical protein